MVRVAVFAGAAAGAAGGLGAEPAAGGLAGAVCSARTLGDAPPDTSASVARTRTKPLIFLIITSTWRHSSDPPPAQAARRTEALCYSVAVKGVRPGGSQARRLAARAFVTARDPEANISSSYGTFKYPETYIINADGKVVEKFVGPENWMDDAIIKRIEKLL